ncbi:hypothetical protein J6590_053838 [Homalodisca vitripennis]|nr:hypothetical protein J6590_053838 [Homalodisca vitripennis]
MPRHHYHHHLARHMKLINQKTTPESDKDQSVVCCQKGKTTSRVKKKKDWFWFRFKLNYGCREQKSRRADEEGREIE